MRGAHSERKPVRREFGLVLGHGQVISNDQVSDNFVLALELGRFGRAAFVRGLGMNGRVCSFVRASAVRM